MAVRNSRRVIGVIFLFFILFNIWHLARKARPQGREILKEPQAPTENDVKPGFGSHREGDSWAKDGKKGGYPPRPQGENNPVNVAPPSGDSFLDSPNGKAQSHSAHHHASAKATTASHAKDTHKAHASDVPKAQQSQGQSQQLSSGQKPAAYDEGMALIKKVLDTIAEITPGVGPLNNYNRDIKSDTDLDGKGELPATSTIMGMYLQIPKEDVETLKRTHKQMFDQLPDKLPANTVSGRGIVMTGGGKYFPMVLTAIRWLRETDKTTPIEVFMADKSEYEPHICDKLFPSLNVECRVVRDIYGGQLSDKLDSKYALKPLAILASKFDDIYFMDADSYPLMDLNRVFDWDVYAKTGYILNSDYWPRYISPHFYEIVGVELGGRARGDPNSAVLLQSDRERAVPGRSTESGQIFVRKSSHIKSLLLAMYYNLYGPDHYFPLLMQKGHGEGDKDTYAAAAIICNESYYQTQRRPVTLGQHLENGDYKGYAMSQPDPISDYERLERGKTEVPEAFFALHANSIKSNPHYLLMQYDEPIRGAPPLRQQRFFGDMNNIRRELLKDDDVEMKLFRVMSEVACDWAVKQGFVPLDWKDSDPQRYCRILQKHTEWLKEHPDVTAPHGAPYWIDLDKE